MAWVAACRSVGLVSMAAVATQVNDFEALVHAEASAHRDRGLAISKFALSGPHRGALLTLGPLATALSSLEAARLSDEAAYGDGAEGAPAGSDAAPGGGSDGDDAPPSLVAEAQRRVAAAGLSPRGSKLGVSLWAFDDAWSARQQDEDAAGVFPAARGSPGFADWQVEPWPHCVRRAGVVTIRQPLERVAQLWWRFEQRQVWDELNTAESAVLGRSDAREPLGPNARSAASASADAAEVRSSPTSNGLLSSSARRHRGYVPGRNGDRDHLDGGSMDRTAAEALVRLVSRPKRLIAPREFVFTAQRAELAAAPGARHVSTRAALRLAEDPPARVVFVHVSCAEPEGDGADEAAAGDSLAARGSRLAPQAGNVRGRVRSVLLLERDGAHATRCTYVAEVDARGWLPRRAVEVSGDDIPCVLAQLRAALEQ